MLAWYGDKAGEQRQDKNAGKELSACYLFMMITPVNAQPTSQKAINQVTACASLCGSALRDQISAVATRSPKHIAAIANQRAALFSGRGGRL